MGKKYHPTNLHTISEEYRSFVYYNRTENRSQGLVFQVLHNGKINIPHNQFLNTVERDKFAKLLKELNFRMSRINFLPENFRLGN